MAGKRIEMKDVHSIVLMLSQGYGTKHISAVLGCARNTVKAYRAIIASKGLSYEELLTHPEEELEGFFTSKKPEEDDRMDRLEVAFKNADGELGKVGVTKFLLWNEYRLSNPDGYSYPQFCKLYRERAETVDVSMHIEHKPGDKLYIDYTGKKIPYVDRSTGEVKDAEIFLTSLGYSEYTYVEASPSQAQECFAESLRHALEYYGGVPQVLVPDNLKSAVKTADKYEAEINALLVKMAHHYDTGVLPARVRKPKDKSIVERHVQIVYQQIFAPLRNMTFFSIDEINAAIKEPLRLLNERHFQGRPFSRKDLFEEEMASLKPLPEHPFEIMQFRMGAVMKNCHVQLTEDCHYYSVPFRYIGEKVKIAYNSHEVRIYLKGTQIAYHLRDYARFKYTTIPDHLPSTHRAYSEWNGDKFVKMAADISVDVKAYIEMILARKEYPEQLYKSCMGVLALGKRHGNDRLIDACRLGLKVGAVNYTFIKNTLTNRTERLWMDDEVETSLPEHGNIRGKEEIMSNK